MNECKLRISNWKLASALAFFRRTCRTWFAPCLIGRRKQKRLQGDVQLGVNPLASVSGVSSRLHSVQLFITATLKMRIVELVLDGYVGAIHDRNPILMHRQLQELPDSHRHFWVG